MKGVRHTLSLVPLLVLAACVDSAPHAEDIEVDPTGKADGLQAVAASLDSQYELEFDPEGYGAFVISIPENEQGVVVVRARDERVNPYIVVKSIPRRALLTSVGQQVVLPELHETDVVVPITGPDRLAVIVTGGPALETGGSVTVDFVSIPESFDSTLSIHDVALGSIVDAMRSHELARARYSGSAVLVENDTGYIQIETERLGDVPLSERSELNRVAVQLNDLREAWYSEANPTQPAAAGRNAYAVRQWLGLNGL